MSKFSTTDIGQSVDLDVESVESKGDIVTPSDIYCNTINALYFNIGGLSITGSLYVPDGTVSLPSYSFTNSTNTGLYLLTSPSTSINFSVSGSNKLQISNTATTLTTPLFLPLGVLRLHQSILVQQEQEFMVQQAKYYSQPQQFQDLI